jgi:hypothetical protein
MRCKIPAQLDARLFDEKPPSPSNAKDSGLKYKRRRFRFQWSEKPANGFFDLLKHDRASKGVSCI